MRLHLGLGLRRYCDGLLQARGHETHIKRTHFAHAQLNVRYRHIAEARPGDQNVIRSRQKTVDEVEPLFVCRRLARSLRLRIENAHRDPAGDGAGGLVSGATDSPPIRLCMETTWRVDKTYQDK